jgi:TPR repeat protein
MAVLQPAQAVAANLKRQPAQTQDDSELPEVRTAIESVSTTYKYIISSFPKINTVAYAHLPDTVWRPLFVNNIQKPMGVCADSMNQRLYVADQVANSIFWYQLIVEKNGLLKTDGVQRVAVRDMKVYWMAVNGIGDLYFTGEKVVQSPDKSARAVYRMDAKQINTGSIANPHELFSTDTSGVPAKATMPSGVAVDSFKVYWGNQEKGKTNGAVCSGTRQNIGVTSGIELDMISDQVDEVRGIAVTGQTVFYLGKTGVYGMDKSNKANSLGANPAVGLIQQSPNTGVAWDPKSIAFDGESTLYWTETTTGTIYQIPSEDTNQHPLRKYVDAPLVYGVTILQLQGLDRPQIIKAELQSSAVVVDEKSGAYVTSIIRPLMLVALILKALVS